jgi:DNA-binding NtrC family response regulator
MCVSPLALAALVEYSWPGNIRQLRSVIERAVAFSDHPEISLDDLPEDIRHAAQSATLTHSAGERKLTLAQVEREYILEVLRRSGGNKSQAAEWLDVPRRTLYRRLEEYGVASEV